MNNKKPAKTIALFSHSSWKGGAEKAFINLVNLVQVCGFKPVIFLPTVKGDLFEFFKSQQLSVKIFEITTIYGETSNGLMDFSCKSLSSIESSIKEEACSLVISNSSTYIDGAIAAANLGLPHIWSIHEMQQNNPEQSQGGVAEGAFARWFAALSDHQIFCSDSTCVAHETVLSQNVGVTVLPPFLESINDVPLEQAVTSGSVTNLMFIGAPTVRKNPVLAIELLAALRGRGRNVYLNFLGGRRDKTGLIEGLLKRRALKPYVNFLGKLDDPYSCFSGKAINLICSKSEPFGLTVPESLSRGIPVVAPNTDGPSEILDPKYQFDLNNLDQCVRLIEKVIDNYGEASRDALENYKAVRSRFLLDYQSDLISDAIEDAFNNYKPKDVPYELMSGVIFGAVNSEILSLDNIIDSISRVVALDHGTINSKIEAEQICSGSAVTADMKVFDVVPHQPSKHMDELYRSGLSFSIELAACYKDPARLKMAAFILVRLCTERVKVGRNLKVLAVGDGIGADSIRLASAGFNVHYMDYEESITSKVANENFKKFNNANKNPDSNLVVLNRHQIESGTYDAVISLEVIEHVEQPQEFLQFLQHQLVDQGLLFISDCFAGIQSYWQTHLLSNERMSGFVPIMAAQNGLAYNGTCQDPLYKPYVFQKSSLSVNELVTQVLNEPLVLQGLLSEQAKLIKLKPRKIDRIMYFFKRLSINFRGYLALRRLKS